ncbi:MULTISPECIES: tetratricopeptide repeat-containing sensor histidine kinase [unclassified Myroides]|uniref:tetratricopeptide repeat-containing sensor histidine kinase n=1 Tax=unclassified Myroides TaxID=2642485 RepID=UPI003D2F6DEC
MRVSPYIVFFTFFCVVSCTQQQNKKKHNDLSNYLTQLEESSIDQKQKIQQLDSIFQTVKEDGNGKSYRELLFKLAGTAYNIEAADLYFKTSQNLLTLAQRAKDTLDIAKAYYYLGDYYEDIVKLDSAYASYSYAAKFYLAGRDTLNVGIMQKSMALILYEEGLFNQAEVEAFAALQKITPYKNTKLLLEAYVTIANILDQNSQSEEAILYYKQALNLLNSLDAKQDITYPKITIYNNIGYLYNGIQKYEKAEETLLDGLSLLPAHMKKSLVHAMLINNLALTYIKTNQLKKAEQLVHEAFIIRDSLQIPQGLISSYSRFGELYLAQRDTVKAIAYWQKGFKTSERVKARNTALTNLRYLSLYDQKNAQEYAQRYYEINDSLKTLQIENRTKFARIEYETAQLEAKNELLAQRVTLFSVLSILAVLLSILIYIVFKQKMIQKRLLFQQHQQQDQELIYKLILQQEEIAKNTLLDERTRISTELHDGIINTLFNIRLMLSNECNAENRQLISSEIEEAQKQIRRISHNLQDQTLAVGSFTPILENLIEKNTTKEHAFTLLISRNFDWSTFDYETKMNIYRIIQESMQNIIKHAQATRSIISIVESTSNYHIKIQDNGIGFKVSEVKKGIGLKNIQLRVNQMNGILTINSNTQKGTILEIILSKVK